MKLILTFLALNLTFSMAISAQDEFAPATYEYYEQTRGHDYAEDVVAQSKETRTEFSNERFVASPESDYWSELTSMWKQNEVNPLWASEQVLKENL